MLQSVFLENCQHEMILREFLGVLDARFGGQQVQFWQNFLLQLEVIHKMLLDRVG